MVQQGAVLQVRRGGARCASDGKVRHVEAGIVWLCWWRGLVGSGSVCWVLAGGARRALGSVE
jgi:hypothetical protein